MNRSRHPLSLGALSLILLLALPTGMLSMFASTTTGEQVDAADSIFVGRVESRQVLKKPLRTIVRFEVDQQLAGPVLDDYPVWTYPGKAGFVAGDEVVVMMTHGPDTLIGQYLIRKNPMTLDKEVMTPVTGMVAQGVLSTSRVSLDAFVGAISTRLGKAAAPAGSGSQASSSAADDALEPNDDLASATPVTLAPPTIVAVSPLCITALDLTLGDIDFFAFDASPLTILTAETVDPGLGPTPDTVLGLFDAGTGELLASNDDKDVGDQLSKLVEPLQDGGAFAVAVTSAPDFDFSGGDGTTTGDYELKLQQERGQYLWNNIDQMLGLSTDGTFIEDFVGYRFIDGTDALLGDMPADGWGLSYTVKGMPTPITEVFGGAGEHLSDPGFTNPLKPATFDIGPFTDANGYNRQGFGEAKATVGYDTPTKKGKVAVTHTYRWSKSDASLMADITITVPLHQPVVEVLFTRLLNVDLFNDGDDRFVWRFSPRSRAKVFAVDAATNVSNVVLPASTGDVTGAFQAAMHIDHDRGGDFEDRRDAWTIYDGGFTLVEGLATEDAAIDAARNNLHEKGLRNWVIAVDENPADSTFTAFGVGLADDLD